MHRTLVIQARVGSKRLPGKMLTSLQGKPIAEWVAIRCKKALSINRWVAAISHNRIILKNAITNDIN